MTNDKENIRNTKFISLYPISIEDAIKNVMQAPQPKKPRKKKKR